MCNKFKWPVFEFAEDSLLLAEWLKAANTGEQLHDLMSNEYEQGFLTGRLLTMMEQQLAFEDEGGAESDET